MSARIIPAAIATVRAEDATLDLVCFEHALSALGDRRMAGKIKGYVEATFEANPGLADLGLILPRGTVVKLPEFVIQTSVPAKRLWDDD
jgi:phage tail protein X